MSTRPGPRQPPPLDTERGLQAKVLPALLRILRTGLPAEAISVYRSDVTDRFSRGAVLSSVAGRLAGPVSHGIGTRPAGRAGPVSQAQLWRPAAAFQL